MWSTDDCSTDTQDSALTSNLWFNGTYSSKLVWPIKQQVSQTDVKKPNCKAETCLSENICLFVTEEEGTSSSDSGTRLKENSSHCPADVGRKMRAAILECYNYPCCSCPFLFCHTVHLIKRSHFQYLNFAFRLHSKVFFLHSTLNKHAFYTESRMANKLSFDLKLVMWN